MNDVPLTSRSKPPLMTPLAQIRLDKIEFRSSIQIIGPRPYTSYILPNSLVSVFEYQKARITGAGFLSPCGNNGGFSTNGAILTRVALGFDSPRKGILRNQFSDGELMDSLGLFTSKDQIELFLSAQHQLYSFANFKFYGQSFFRLPIVFPFIEFYVELLSPSHREQFFKSCAREISKLVGVAIREANEVREVSERASVRSNFEQVWELDNSVKRYRGERVRLKLYDKGTRVRLEVSFRGFRTRTQSSPGQVIQSDEMVNASRNLIGELHLAATDIINGLLPRLSGKTSKSLNAEALRNKFKEYGVRGVKGPAYSHMIKSFDERGVYEVSTVPPDERPSKMMLNRMSGMNGILIKKSVLDVSGKPKRNFYELRDDWEKVQPKKDSDD